MPRLGTPDRPDGYDVPRTVTYAIIDDRENTSRLTIHSQRYSRNKIDIGTSLRMWFDDLRVNVDVAAASDRSKRETWTPRPAITVYAVVD